MIVLDTNVLSALMQREPPIQVVAWLDAQPPESIWTTSVSVFEICFGLEVLEKGRRRRTLEDAFTRTIAEDLEGRVLAFDESAAWAAAILASKRRRKGRPIEIRDVQIAGIATARRAAVATRNTRHFEGIGLTLIDPWS